MSFNRNWCWELESSKHGPDWLCVVETTPESAAHLEELISHLSLPSYRYIPVSEQYCYRHNKICSYHIFFDESHAQQMIANLQGTSPSNIWIYNSIEIHNGVITIECGYGGADVYHTIETSFLINLCNNPNIAIAQWNVCAGGMGYDYVTLKQGKNSAELQHYITAE